MELGLQDHFGGNKGTVYCLAPWPKAPRVHRAQNKGKRGGRSQRSDLIPVSRAATSCGELSFPMCKVGGLWSVTEGPAEGAFCEGKGNWAEQGREVVRTGCGEPWAGVTPVAGSSVAGGGKVDCGAELSRAS